MNVKKEGRWDTAMQWNCLKLYFKWLVTFRYEVNIDTLRRTNQNLSCFSIFVLFLLSETTNTFKRAIQEETDPYKRRDNQVQDVCSQHGLTPESDGKTLHEDGIDFREIHLKYTSKVPEKVTW